ncbi:MAG: hypothetical protein KJ623_01255 [Nanoarchaeota archaeon]|nr:hypothetical protein [Nanoarchaeota archaeon]MBU0962733.1 hypothetical protein [Nanoarchaeota archaeon]
MKPVPNPITLNTDYHGEISKIIDDFFIETKEFVEEYYEAPKWDVPKIGWQIRSGEIAYDTVQITNDRITYLTYRDMFILASVLETRTEFNYVHYTFFRDLDGFKKIAELVGWHPKK